MARLQEFYKQEVVPALRERFGYRNVMEVPKITKITLNMGVGEAARDRKVLEYATRDMALIAGKKPVVTLTRKSIAGYGTRDGWPTGCKARQRRERTDEFLDPLVDL